MLQIDTARLWGIPDFTVSEGKIKAGSANCVWCENAVSIGEFVLVVQVDSRADAFVMHPKCLPSEVKAARKLAIDLRLILPFVLICMFRILSKHAKVCRKCTQSNILCRSP